MKKVPVLEVIAATAVATIATCVLLLLLPQLRNEVSAAWAQGILTALGIGVAMYAANRQAQDARAHALELRQEDLNQKRRGIAAIAEAAFDEMQAIEQACNNHNLELFFDEQYHKEQFNHIITALQAIPLHELHSYNMVVGILDLTDALLRTQAYCEMVLDEENRGSATAEEFYYAYQDENNTKAFRAMTFIRGGILGWTTEEINRRNGLQDADF
jgi:hypothetical protein